MDFIIEALKKAAFFLGLHVPDVVNDDLGSDESSAERKSRFAELVAVEEDIKEEVASNESYALETDDWDEEGVA
jgi:hypothetical protein